VKVGIPSGDGNHLTSYLMGTVGSFLGVEWQGREVDYICYTSKRVKIAWM